MALLIFLCLVLLLRVSVAEEQEASVNLTPIFPATYEMNSSTIIMICNYSGYFSTEVVGKLAHFGIVDIDWSNAKKVWANTSPMDDQQWLLTQAKAIKEANPATKVWVYRNLVKALPWFADVREKILDPAYNEHWFLKFKAKGPYHVPACTNTSNTVKCSALYHDQEHGTPEHPAWCTGVCDCGAGLPCGEYLWDHRNQSLQQWLTDVFIMGPAGGTGMNNDAISGFYIDDLWNHAAPNQQCNGDAFGGPTEIDEYCNQDMGLSQADVTALTNGWHQTMNTAQTAIIAAGGFSWKLFRTVSSPDSSACASWLRTPGMNLHTSALMFKHLNLIDTQPQFEIDLAMFLLVRGPYAWLGYAWNGCHDTWAYMEWNSMLDKDYGVPQKPMAEIQTGVFQREWSKCVVQMDCNTYKPSFHFQ